MSGKNIVHRNLAERSKGKTNWTKLRNQSEADIQRAAKEDADNPIWTKEELRGASLALPSGAAKVPLSIRLDREVIEYFKSQGDGYQSRMGAVLLSYVRTQENAHAPKRSTRTRVASKVASGKKMKTTTKRTAAKRKKPTASRK